MRAEASEGEDGAGLLAEVFGVARAVPEVLEGFDLVLELSSREVDGEAFFFFDVLLRLEGQHVGEPLGDAGGDLADAGLGNAEFLSDLAGGAEFDEGEAVDFEIAGSGRKCGQHGKLLEKRTKNQEPKNQEPKNQEPKNQEPRTKNQEPKKAARWPKLVWFRSGVYEGGWTSLVHFSQGKKRFFEIVGATWGPSRGDAERGREGVEESKGAMLRWEETQGLWETLV